MRVAALCRSADDRRARGADGRARSNSSIRSSAPARTRRRRSARPSSEHSVPLLAEIQTERDALAATVLPKSPLGEAVRYLTNQWDALQRFVDDGRFGIDNNRAENQLRVVALGRKNWLFAGSFEGARRAALLYSLVQSCTLVDVVALRLPERRPAPRRHPSAAAHRRTHAPGLGRHLRPARRRLRRSDSQPLYRRAERPDRGREDAVRLTLTRWVHAGLDRVSPR